MSESPDTGPDSADGGSASKRKGGLNTMLIADLKSMAGGLGISGANSMKKADLVSAIKSAQGGQRHGSSDQGNQHQGRQDQGGQNKGGQDQGGQAQGDQQQGGRQERQPRGKDEAPRHDGGHSDGAQDNHDRAGADQSQGQPKNKKQQNQKNDQQQNQKHDQQQEQAKDQADHGEADTDEDGQPRTRSRRRRGRDRQNRQTPGQPGQSGQAGQVGQSGQASGRNEPDTTILDDDVLVPAAGILDVLDSYAFVRTVGYLPSPDDVYLSLSMVRKFGLRRGDQLVGQVRQPREGERKEKFNPMVRIDTVNGHAPEMAIERPEFDKLVPLHPTERLRMETGSTNVAGRVIDLAAPIGKGQRGLIVSPARGGKTSLIQAIAASVTANAPEAHLMVVLVDERPEEVTDFKRDIKGEVAASTFDHPPADHVAVAELAIERAKRLVEQGLDVIVLIDGLTRLTRAYNLAIPASGRVLAGGVDPAAVHPPKRFFGAARNIQNGGSLTIIATATVDSGSEMDATILEEFQGTENWELRLRRDLAEKRLFPAVDVAHSGTAHEDLLMSEEELAIVRKWRTALATVAPEAALESVLRRVDATKTNIEALMQVQRADAAQLTR